MKEFNELTGARRKALLFRDCPWLRFRESECEGGSSEKEKRRAEQR